MKPKLIALALIATVLAACQQEIRLTILTGGDEHINYYGRTDFSDPQHPKQWAAGAYFSFDFEGDFCVVNISDEYNSNRRANMLEVVIDNLATQNVITKDSITTIAIGNVPEELLQSLKGNVIRCYDSITDAKHSVTICRNTETAMGYTQVNNITAPKFPPNKAKQACGMIEFIGNSITCGAEADTTLMPGAQYQWGDWHRAYYGYGPRTARKLGSAWSLVSVSGIGLIHSCCDMGVTMPQVYDKYVLRYDQKPYEKRTCHPTTVCICLGQNDGIQDSTTFCSTYVDFVKRVQAFNDNEVARFVLLTSPMADNDLREWQKNMLTAIAKQLEKENVGQVSTYFFSRAWNGGGMSHPSVEEHEQIADELSNYIKSIH